MSDSGIQPGDFVQYNHLGASGIGKVKETGDSLLVQFWNEKEERKSVSGLTPLSVAEAGPVKSLWDSPGELASWAREKPLKLVALALSIDGGKGNPGKIKEKLDGRVPLGADWKTWWGKRAKSLNALSDLPEPEYFDKSAKGNEYTLLCGIGDVPDDAQAPLSLADWKKWLLNDLNLPTFGKNPSKMLSESLAEWPEDTIERALKRVLWGAELLLDAPKKPSAAAALAWMDAVGSVASRWCSQYPDSHQPAERSGEVLARLSQRIKVKEKRKEATLFWAGALSESPDRQRQLEELRQEQERRREALAADHAAELEKLRQKQERQREAHAAELEKLQQEQERQKAAHTEELATLRTSHAEDGERERREQERLQGRVETLRNQLFSGYELSKLDIRKDMLVLIGELSQLATKQDCPSDNFVRDVRDGLALALQAGGANMLGTIGEIARFDPSKHQAAGYVKIGDSVKITIPGVKVKGQHTDDSVLVKAQVSGNLEES